MTHWADDYIDELEDIIDDTGWNMNITEGPITFEHQDGSELFFGNIQHLSRFKIEYTASDTATTAVDSSAGEQAYVYDKGNQSTQLSDIMEWVEHILEKHESDN